MNKQLKNTVNNYLKSLDIALYRSNTVDDLKLRYQSLVKEMHDGFAEVIFPDLPYSEGRIELTSRLLGTNVSEALYIIKYLHESLNIAGDICEFGVAQGATSALMANEIKATSKHLWLFDSFQGLPKPTEKDVLIDDIYGLGEIDKYEGTMSTPVGVVQQRLKEIAYPTSRTQIVAGFIEETIANDRLPEQVCFAYIDFDFYQPILVALNFLDPLMPVGGHIIVDDYEFFSSGVKSAVDEFVEEQSGKYEAIKPYNFAGNFIILKKQNA